MSGLFKTPEERAKRREERRAAWDARMKGLKEKFSGLGGKVLERKWLLLIGVAIAAYFIIKMFINRG